VADSSAAFGGSIPEFYDRHLGPLFFEAYARDLAARLAPPATPRRVLELACGTGIATRRLRERLARDVTLVATDLNEGMLAVARVNAGAQTALTFQRADASSLPFADAEHAAVVCQFGWMFFPDKPRAARRARGAARARAGRPAAVQRLGLARRESGRPHHARDARAPVPRRPAGLLPRAVRLPRSRRDSRAEHVAIGLVRGNPVITAIQQRGADPERVVDAVASALRAQLGRGLLVAPMRALAISARRP
jgi:SAM-dependent methyltransferase